MAKKKKLKPLTPASKAVYTVIALVLTLVVTLAVLSAGLTFTLFSRAHAERLVVSNGIVEEAEKQTEERIRAELQNSGVGEDFISSLLPEDVKGEIFHNIGVLYGDGELDKEHTEYKEKLRELFWEELARQNGGKADRNSREDRDIVELLTNTVITVFEENTTLPFDAEQVAAPYINQFKNIVRLAAIVLAVITVIIIFTLPARYVSLSFGGAGVLFFGTFLLIEISGIFKGISVGSGTDDLLLKAIAGDIGKLLLISFAVCFVLWLVLMLIGRARDKKLERSINKRRRVPVVEYEEEDDDESEDDDSEGGEDEDDEEDVFD